MFWTALLVWAIGTLVMELIRPKPNIEDARPASLGDFSFPTATEGRSVPIVWGKIKIDGPNVVWFGNLRQVAITEEVKTGLFSSDTVTTGYRYYVGMHFALCRGPNVTLRNVLINEKNAYSGNANGDGVYGGVSAANILGGEEFGQGGVVGTLRFYSGNFDQSTNAYMQSRTSSNIAYRGTAHAVWEGGWVGNSPSIPPWAFVVERIPDGLNLASTNPGAEEPTAGTCNPMNVLYEILTDTMWGMGEPVSKVDLANFRDVAGTCYDEGNGFAMMIDNPMQVEDVIREVERQIDGSLYFDRTAAAWRVKLARADYTVGDLTVFDESNIVELVDYTRQTWEETANEVRVKYIDNTKNFNASYAIAQDIANMALQGTSVSVEQNFPGCKDAALANQLAWRELKVQAFPLGKINFKVNREGFALIPGSVFKFSWARLGLAEVVYRVSEIDPGNLDSKAISVFAVQDVFAAGSGVFSPPAPSGWVDQPQEAVAPDTDYTLVFEAPRQMVIQDRYAPDLQPRAWGGARWPGGGTINFRMYTRTGSSRPLGGTFNADSSVQAFLLVGELDADVPDYGSAAVRPDTSYFIDVTNSTPDDLTSLIVAGSAATVRSLLTIIYVGGEFIGFHTMTDAGGGVIRLSSIYRGLFNSAPKAHATGTKVWFIGQTGGNLTRTVFTSSSVDEIDIQLRSQDSESTMAEGDVPIEQLHMDYLHLCPLAPRDPLLHGSFTPSSATLDTQYLAGTGLTGDNARALKVEVTPRAWRVDDILDDTNLDLSVPAYLDDNPTFDFYLVLDPDGSPTVLDAVAVSGTETPIAYILRNAAIVAAGANNAIPSTGLVRVTAKHTVDGTVYTNPDDMEYQFTLTSGLQTDDLLHGGLDVNVASTAVIYGETGTYSFNIFTALPSSGILEANVNGGGWNPVVTAGTSTGNLSVTAGDSVVLRFTQAPTNDQFFTVTGPTSEVGHGVLKA